MANIITLSEYRVYDDSPSPTANEPQITAAIALATAAIEKMTGRVFEIAGEPSPVSVTEIVNGRGTHRVYSHNAPLTALTKLEYWDGTQWIEYDVVQYPYTFKPLSNIAYFTQGHKFYNGWQNIRMTYEYGFDTAFPNDLKLACYLTVKHIIAESERLGISSQSDGEQTFSYDHSLPTEVVKLIRRYKLDW